jgi:hypothetical protein
MGNGGGKKTYPSVPDTPYKDTAATSRAAAAEATSQQQSTAATEAEQATTTENVVHAPGASVPSALPAARPQRAMSSSIGNNMTGSSVVTG